MSNYISTQTIIKDIQIQETGATDTFNKLIEGFGLLEVQSSDALDKFRTLTKESVVKMKEQLELAKIEYQVAKDSKSANIQTAQTKISNLKTEIALVENVIRTKEREHAQAIAIKQQAQALHAKQLAMADVAANKKAKLAQREADLARKEEQREADNARKQMIRDNEAIKKTLHKIELNKTLKAIKDKEGASTLKNNRYMAEQNLGLGQLSTSIANYGIQAIAAKMSIQALMGAWNMGKAEAVQDRFENIFDSMAKKAGYTAEQIIASMDKVAPGLLTKGDQIKGAVAAMTAGLSPAAMPGLVALARNVEALTGETLATSFTEVVDAMSGVQPKFLKQIGIFTDMGDAVEEYAKKNNIAVQSLNLAEKAQITQQALLDATKKKMAELNIEVQSNVDVYTENEVKIEDLKGEIGKLLNEAIIPFSEDLKEATTSLLDFFRSMTDPESRLEKVKHDIEVVRHQIATLIDDQWYYKLKRQATDLLPLNLLFGKKGAELDKERAERAEVLTAKFERLTEMERKLTEQIHKSNKARKDSIDIGDSSGNIFETISNKYGQLMGSGELPSGKKPKGTPAKKDKVAIDDAHREAANKSIKYFEADMNKMDVEFSDKDDYIQEKLKSIEDLKAGEINAINEIKQAHMDLQLAKQTNNVKGQKIAEETIKTQTGVAKNNRLQIGLMNKNIKDHENKVKFSTEMASTAYDLYTQALQVATSEGASFVEVMGIMIQQMIGETLVAKGRAWVIEGAAEIASGNVPGGVALIAAGVAAGAIGTGISSNAQQKMNKMREDKAEKEQKKRDAEAQSQKEAEKEIERAQKDREAEKQRLVNKEKEEARRNKDNEEKQVAPVNITISAFGSIDDHAAKEIVKAVNKYGNSTGHKITYKKV